MKKTLLPLLALLVLAFFGATLTTAQEAAKPEEAAPAEKVEVAKPETISGTISSVLTDKKLVIITDSRGTPFNFKVTGGTRIKVAGKKAKLVDLANETNKTASVKFLPLRSGNVAQSIEVSQ